MKLLWRLQRSPRTASEWFSLVRSGRLDEHADKKWVAWIGADLKHEEAYAARELAWEFAADLRETSSIDALLKEADALVENSRRPTSLPPGRRLLLSWQAGVAASILAVGVLIFLLLGRDRSTASEFSTAVGEQRTVALEDRTTVTLNTATKIRVLYSRATRRIEVVDGEALFEVGKDVTRPFEVHAQQGVTTALGTQFDVRVNGTAVEVSVLEGSVAVAADDTGKNGTPISVPEGKSVDYSRGGPVSALRAADSASILGWKAQRIVFNDVPLSSALREYNRYIQVPIVLGSPEMADRHIHGVFRIGDEDAFLGALQRGMHLKATQTNTQTLLSTH